MKTSSILLLLVLIYLSCRDADGSVNEFIILESAGKKLDKEVIRVLETMEPWMPAIRDFFDQVPGK